MVREHLLSLFLPGNLGGVRATFTGVVGVVKATSTGDVLSR